jgi:Fic family protein
MTAESDKDRHSRADIPDLIADPTEKAEKESLNALRQVDAVVQAIETGLDPERKFRLRPSLILHLHRIVLNGIDAFAGNWRPGNVEIGKSLHQPPGAHLVPELVEEMCDYVNDNWESMTAVELAAYMLWRLNWIHPFTDGNGRTARAISYVVLCVRLGTQLPGRRTIPEQISENKAPYYRALEAADEADREGRTDVSVLAAYLHDLLGQQLLYIHEEAEK